MTPEKLSVHLEGGLGPSFSVKLIGGQVQYKAGRGYSYDKSVKLEPTVEQWQKFRDALNQLRIWGWRDEYPNPGVLDGTSWSVRIRYSDVSVTSEGCNNYPLADGRPSDSSENNQAFERFLKSMRELLGGLELC